MGEEIKLIQCVMGLSLGLLMGCGSEDSFTNATASSAQTAPGGVPRDAVISWTANKEKAVNQPGGGYKVYYSAQPFFPISSVTPIDVPYVSGANAPTSVTLPGLNRGQKYYVKVIAYSSLVPPAGGAGSTSIPSIELTIGVPL